MKRFLLSALLIAFFVAPHTAVAQQHVVVDNTVKTTTSSTSPSAIQNSNTSTLETIACNSGLSPCTFNGASNTTILNANANRHECLLQNVGTGDVVCIKGPTGFAITTANMHFVLKAATSIDAGDGGTYSCNSGPVVWSGTISCSCGPTPSTDCTLNASAD